MQAQKFETQWGGKTLSIEVGKLAQQTNGSCVVRYGDTVILATSALAEKSRDAVDFFPLSVEYEEKLYAVGKIKSSRFIKREGRPTDEAVMTGRMIDRSIRPLFPEGVRHDVQVVVECLSADMENDTDILALVGASCALAISDIPWAEEVGHIAGIRVGRIGGEWVINPTFDARSKSDLEVIVAGTHEKALMIEAAAKEVPEADMYQAIVFGQKHIKVVTDLIAQVVAAVGKPKKVASSLKGSLSRETPEERAAREAIVAKAEAFLAPRIEAVLFDKPHASKVERRHIERQLTADLDAHLAAEGLDADARAHGTDIVYDYIEAAVSRFILKTGRRVDGRSLTEVRNLSAEVALLPRTHGTGLFLRGETQVLSIVTLGAPSDAQVLDGMEEVGKKRYMHHYNFPPFSVGETGRFGGGGRREIGHGGLAERALLPVLPSKEEFPYVVRVVSEVLSSNGSSSQASICGSTLALMDAGVPIKRPVAGIAMGLASDATTGEYKILTDLQDLEDGHGGMDFKIGGTSVGITTIQLDTKTKGLSQKLIEETLVQGRDARMKVLEVMATAIAAPRKELSPYAPRIETININPELIRNVIGPGGKIINEIIEKTGVTMDVENDGTITICSANKSKLDEAVQWVKALTREVAVGELFKEAKIVRIMDFGAFAELVSGKDGLIHISELAPWRVGKVGDIVKVGDVVPVKVIEIDELGRVNLSLKAAYADLSIEQKRPDAPAAPAAPTAPSTPAAGEDTRFTSH